MSDEETPALIAKRINKIAEEICSRSLLGLVHNRPELWAQPAGCFATLSARWLKMAADLVSDGPFIIHS